MPTIIRTDNSTAVVFTRQEMHDLIEKAVQKEMTTRPRQMAWTVLRNAQGEVDGLVAVVDTSL